MNGLKQVVTEIKQEKLNYFSKLFQNFHKNCFLVIAYLISNGNHVNNFQVISVYKIVTYKPVIRMKRIISQIKQEKLDF